jgi:hypothetical protein
LTQLIFDAIDKDACNADHFKGGNALNLPARKEAAGAGRRQAQWQRAIQARFGGGIPSIVRRMVTGHVGENEAAD